MAIRSTVQAKDALERAISGAGDALIRLSHVIHERPETAFEEHYAAGRVAEELARHGFEIEEGVGGLPTAIRATCGQGPLTFLLCAEYDALPDIGHACGHNVIAASSTGAAIGLSEVADDLGVEIVVLGTPAEESGGGKIKLLEAGAFDSANAALMVHPAPYDVVAPPIMAVDWIDVRYEGREAHASAFPEEGINAADAMVIGQVAMGLLRQHLPSSVRVHGFVSSAGSAANVIPALATGNYMVRTEQLSALEPLRERVAACFEAGAVATGAKLELSRPQPPYAHLEHDPDLGSLYRANALRLGRRFHEGPVAPVSTDMGNVSLRVPTLHPFIGIGSLPAVNHQPGFAKASVSTSADQAVVDGATALAWTIVDATQGEVRRKLLQAREEA